MTSAAGEWGPNLYRHLEAHWRATGTTQNAWCEVHGFHPSTVYRWGQGKQPGLEHMHALAAALGVNVLDVLLIAGVVDPKDVRRDVTPPPVAPPPEVAIKADPTLSEWQRRHLLDFLASLREVANEVQREQGGKVRGRKSRSL